MKFKVILLAILFFIFGGLCQNLNYQGVIPSIVVGDLVVNSKYITIQDNVFIGFRKTAPSIELMAGADFITIRGCYFKNYESVFYRY